MTRANVPEDLWEKVDRSAGPKACWPYIERNANRPGWHGRMSLGGREVIASRLAWELTFGPIPEGLHVLHACDNPPCCNPGHLMLGTILANGVDASRKGRAGGPKGATHCKRGHAFGGNTYIHPITGRRSCQECIRQRDRARPARPPKGGHWARPDDEWRCLECGEALEYGQMGKGRIGWRHSRWAA